MNINDKTYELIEKYLGGLMSDEQRTAFELQMEENQELADQVSIFKMMPGYLSDESFPDSEYESGHPKAKAYLDEFLKEETNALKDHLDAKGEEFSNQSNSNNRMGVWRVMRVAAVLLVMVAAATFLFRPSETDRLYSQYTDHTDISINVRAASDPLAEEAETLYNSGKYEQAIPKLEELMSELESTDYDVMLALGISQLETEEFDAAFGSFNSIYNSQALIRDHALYYLAMTHLRSGNKLQAYNTLKTLREEFPDHNAEQVSKLIKRLAPPM